MRLWLVGFMMMCWLLPAMALDWGSLSPQEQELLQRYKARWATFSENRQQGFRQAARQWIALSPEQQQAARQRFEAWKALPPTRKEALRHQFMTFRALEPALQNDLRDIRQWFADLPDEEQAVLVLEWQNTTLEQRKAFREALREKYSSQ